MTELTEGQYVTVPRVTANGIEHRIRKVERICHRPRGSAVFRLNAPDGSFCVLPYRAGEPAEAQTFGLRVPEDQEEAAWNFGVIASCHLTTT